MGLFLAFWRRLFGGYDAKYDIFEKRGILMILCILVTFLWEFFIMSNTWWISLIISILVYIFWCKGHYYYFLCGTETDEYIDEQEAKGRKPAMNWIVAPVNKWLGFKPRSKQYCFIGMMIRYTFWAIPLIFFVGWKFFAAGFAIPFIYNAMFWVDLPKTKWCGSPTNWAEWFSGLIIGWALM
jgi:hypothetical protein